MKSSLQRLLDLYLLNRLWSINQISQQKRTKQADEFAELHFTNASDPTYTDRTKKLANEYKRKKHRSQKAEVDSQISREPLQEGLQGLDNILWQSYIAPK